MHKILKFSIYTLSLVLLANCQGQFNKQSGGTLIGGVTGGLLGAQFGKGEGKLVATGVGALAGALVGGQIGKSLDEYDQQMLKKSSQQALEFAPAGNSVEWRNPDSGNHGSITPTRTFREQGQYCREYQQQIIVGGETKNAYGKACRQPDGSWKIIK
ncbi:MAG: RT0821/Lpp0805 family surface protein [Rickettsiaceae bacterium]